MEKLLKELQLMPHGLTWPEMKAYKRFNLWRVRNVRAFLVAIYTQAAKTVTVKCFPKRIRGVLLAALLPYFMVIPYSLQFSITEYYGTIDYFWILSGPHFTAFISLLIIYIYRKSSTLPIIIKFSLSWHIIEIALQFTITGNNDVFAIHHLALVIYSAIVLFIFSVHLPKIIK
jgi:hypothetical protein